MKRWILLGILGSSAVAWAGEIRDLYERVVPLSQRVKEEKEGLRSPVVPPSKHGVTEIGLERTTCYGTCPAYSAIIKNDGILRYTGISYVEKERMGKHTGKVSTWQFDKLAQFITDANYMGLKTTYTIGVTDGPTVYTTVVMHGKRKVISDYALAGPSKLWAIEQLIDQLLETVTWDKKSTASKIPQTFPPKIIMPNKLSERK